MVYIIITGRLGNILFQIAAAKSLSTEITAIALYEWPRQVFNQYKDTLFSGIDLIDYIPDNVSVFKEKTYCFSPIEWKGEDIILKGYFQSFKYLDRKQCQALYRCPDDVRKDIDIRFGNILNSFKTVSVNIRRGDYLKLPHRHPFCGLEYFKKAMEHFSPDYYFIISSDDIEWCKKHFIGDNYVFVENSYPLLDLYIQTVCSHNIISNSSFSWWGAFLNKNDNQLVIAPERWYGRDLEKENSTADLLPNEYKTEKCLLPVGQYALAICLSIKDKIKKRFL